MTQSYPNELGHLGTNGRCLDIKKASREFDYILNQFIDGPKEIACSWNYGANQFTFNNIGEIKRLMVKWKKTKYQSLKNNFKTINRLGKTFYYLCLQDPILDRSPTQDKLAIVMETDNTFIVSGIGYIFKSKTNRDRIHKYLN